MPVITVEAGKMDKDQKRALIEALSKNASEVLNIPVQAFVVLLKENDEDNVGVGGELLSVVKAKRTEK